MCGINGFVYKNFSSSEASNVIDKMNNLIIHRGPDSSGKYINYNNKNNNSTIGLGMQRLSIIDLKGGDQPVYSEDKKIIIVFNGEIYNFRYLKSQLVHKGLKFRTKSDTEVILKLYETYGTDSFSMLDGMFSFSILDLKKDKTYLVRDFFGEKPLYFFKSDDKMIWASELKSIISVLPNKPEICKEALALYFRLTYIPAPYSIYNGIRKLKPGNYLEIDNKSLKFSTTSYKKEKDFESKNLTFEEAKNETFKLVNESVNSRLISDVPIGTFLSGGVDSSIVSLCHSFNSPNKIDTFSVGFTNKKFDESAKARTVSSLINSNHHEINIDVKSMSDDINYINNFDEPFADSSLIPMYLISKFTKKNVKVVLSGDGGDEVFGGYNKYLMGKLNNNYTRVVPKFLQNKILKTSQMILKSKSDKRGFNHKLSKFLNSVSYSDYSYLSIISLGFNDQEVNNYLKNEFQKNDVFNNYNINKLESLTDFRNLDRHISLEGDLLVKVDRTTMLNSLECRSPFLNYDLWKFTSAIDENFLIKNTNKKYLLKKSFEKYFPNKFLDKPKKGFEVPVGDWLRLNLKNELLKYIETSFLEKQSIFEIENIQKTVNQHVSGKFDHTFKVWTFFCFQKWYNDIYA